MKMNRRRPLELRPCAQERISATKRGRRIRTFFLKVGLKRNGVPLSPRKKKRKKEKEKKSPSKDNDRSGHFPSYYFASFTYLLHVIYD